MGAHLPDVAVSTSVVADDTSKRRTEMGKIVISENVSLDGVIQDPDGEEGFQLVHTADGARPRLPHLPARPRRLERSGW
jgi:hypothetical protein